MVWYWALGSLGLYFAQVAGLGRRLVLIGFQSSVWLIREYSQTLGRFQERGNSCNRLGLPRPRKYLTVLEESTGTSSPPPPPCVSGYINGTATPAVQTNAGDLLYISRGDWARVFNWTFFIWNPHVVTTAHLNP